MQSVGPWLRYGYVMFVMLTTCLINTVFDLTNSLAFNKKQVSKCFFVHRIELVSISTWDTYLDRNKNNSVHVFCLLA